MDEIIDTVVKHINKMYTMGVIESLNDDQMIFECLVKFRHPQPTILDALKRVKELLNA